jgi:hypothetical protein
MSVVALRDSPSAIRSVLGDDPDEAYGLNDGYTFTNMTLYACILNNCTLINCKLYKCVVAKCTFQDCKLVECRSASDDIQTLASGKSSARWMLGGMQQSIGY